MMLYDKGATGEEPALLHSPHLHCGSKQQRIIRFLYLYKKTWEVTKWKKK